MRADSGLLVGEGMEQALLCITRVEGRDGDYGDAAWIEMWRLPDVVCLWLFATCVENGLSTMTQCVWGCVCFGS